jgi:hypothetical protein
MSLFAMLTIAANTTPTIPADVLAQLKDIHLPNAVSWWPLALGWWIVLMIGVGLLLAGVYFYRRWQRKSPQELIIAQSLQLFHALQTQSLTPKVFIMELSELLRRTALSLYGRKTIANLAGDDWLQFLNQKGATTAFTDGEGRVLADQPYRAEVDYDHQALVSLIEQWLEQQSLHITEKNSQKGVKDA